MSVTNEIVKFVAEIELDAQDKAAFTKALKDANDECATFRKEIAKTETEMAKLAASGKKDSDEFKKLGEQLNQAKDKLKASSKEANKYASALGVNQMTYNQLKAHASRLRKELNSLHKESDPKVWEKYNKELVATEKRMQEVQGGMKQGKTAIESLSAIGKKLGPTITIASSLFGLFKSGFRQMTEQTQVWGDKWQLTVTKVQAGWNQFIANLGQGKDVVKASVNDAVQAAAEAQLLYDELFERESSLKIISVKTQTEINKLMAEVKDSTLPESVRLQKIDQIIEKEKYLAGVKKSIAQQELDAAAKVLNTRTGLDEEGLRTAIDEYELHRDKFKLAEEYLAVCEEVEKLQAESNRAAEQAYQNIGDSYYKEKSEEALAAYTAALKRQKELETEETKRFANLIKQYNLGNDEMVNKYVAARLKMLEADETLSADSARLAERTSSLVRQMRSADAEASNKAYNNEIDAAEQAYRTELNSLKQQLLDRTISQEEYNTRSAELEMTRLETLRTLNQKYGKDVSVIDGQILDERLKNQTPEKKNRPTTDLSVSGNLTSMLPGKATTDSDPGIAKTFDQEMTALNLLHEAKAISEEEYLKRRNELYEKYGIEQQEKEQTLWDQGAEGKLKVTQMMLDGMAQAVSAAKDAELATLDAQMQAELAAAGDNAEKREQIEAEYEAKKLDVQKKYADVELGISIAQAIAQGALAVIQSWAQLGPIAGSIFAAVIAATTAAQIAVMVQQRNAIKNSAPGGSTSAAGTTSVRMVNGYSEGGYTGDGGRLEVAGVVHRGEYVVPQPELRDPQVAAMVATIESRRRRRTSANALPGFAEGGYTGLASGGTRQTEDLLTRILVAIQSNNENPVPAYVVLSELNAQQETMARHKASVSLRRKSRA